MRSTSLLILISVALITASACDDTSSGGAAGDAVDAAQGTDTAGADSGAKAEDTGPTTSPVEIDPAVEHLIVTGRDLVEPFEGLARWRSQKGLRSQVVAFEDVEGSTEGRDAAERLRNFLKRAAAEATGLRYVLLGGDVSVIPSRRMYVSTDVYGFYWTDALTPVELYFSDLDGDWDADGDDEFGEVGDGLDMHADLSVGRLPVESAEEAQVIIGKILTYEQAPPTDYLEQALFMSEPTGYEFQGMEVSSSVLLDKWADQMMPDNFNVSKLYDDADNYTDALPHTAANSIMLIEKGHSLVVHLGHGVESMLGLMDRAEVKGLTNGPDYPVFVSCACSAGNFDGGATDSVGEEWLKNPNGGGVAYIGNTDIGIGYPPGQAFIRSFFDAVFDGRPRIGDAWVDALEDYVPDEEVLHDERDCYRYTHFILILLGDPGTEIWTAAPRTLDVALDAGDAGLEVVVTDADGGTALPGATVTCLADGIYARATTDASGAATLALPDGQTSGCTLTVSAQDYVPKVQEL